MHVGSENNKFNIIHIYREFSYINNPPRHIQRRKCFGTNILYTVIIIINSFSAKCQTKNTEHTSTKYILVYIMYIPKKTSYESQHNTFTEYHPYVFPTTHTTIPYAHSTLVFCVICYPMRCVCASEVKQSVLSICCCRAPCPPVLQNIEISLQHAI